MKKLKIILAGLVLVAGLITFAVMPVLAVGGTFFVNPASGSVVNGNNLTFAVRINTGGEQVNSVQADLTYPADKFDFVSISTAGTSFNIEVKNTGGNGSLQLWRGSTGTPSGDLLIGTVTLRAKVSSGSGTVSYASSSEAYRVSDSTNIVTARNGGTYTFTAPPEPDNNDDGGNDDGGGGGSTGGGSTGGGGSSGGGSSGGGSTGGSNNNAGSTTPEADTTAPKITSGPQVTSVSKNSAVIEWETDEDTTSVVDFGPDTSYGITNETEGLTKTHKVTVTSELLVPGLEYHYRVKSVDAGGNEVLSDDHTFETSGMSIIIQLKLKNGSPVSGVGVTIDGQTAKTDKTGNATFDNIAVGDHDVKLDRQATLNPSSISVVQLTDEEDPETQQTFEITVEDIGSPALSKKWLALLLVLLILTIGGGGTWLYLGKPNLLSFLNGPKAPTSPQEIVAGLEPKPEPEPVTVPENQNLPAPPTNGIDAVPHPEVPEPGRTFMPSSGTPSTPPAPANQPVNKGESANTWTKSSSTIWS